MDYTLVDIESEITNFVRIESLGGTRGGMTVMLRVRKSALSIGGRGSNVQGGRPYKFGPIKTMAIKLLAQMFMQVLENLEAKHKVAAPEPQRELISA